MSCLRCFCQFTYSVSSSLQGGSCLVYVVFVCLRIVSLVLCRRDHILLTLCLLVYVQCLQFFVGWIICLVYVGFVRLRIVSPFLCKRDHFLFTLLLLVYVQCLQFFVGRIMSCLRCVCLFTQCLQFFLRGIMSCLRCFCLFTYSVSSSLQEGSCLVYVCFVCLRIVSPVLCKRDHVLFTLFLFVYVQCLQFFVGGIMSCLRWFCLFTYSVSSSLQEGSCLAYVVVACLRIVSTVLCRRDHLLFTLVLFVYVQCLKFFVRGIMSCLRCFCLFTYSVSNSL